jgi:uncharacterized short protein YbdD (DUF466 family)
MAKFMSITKIIKFLRQLSGDDAYERYLIHWQQHHAASNEEPQSRKAFFQARLEQKWNGVKRCC